MRALRVLGLAQAPENGTVQNLVCEDPDTGEQFSVACDDRLRAAARGDLSRLGQLEIEMESQLRPREIQARIRSGATVEQVAAAAGTTTSRVERFAYPVLLERASVVEKAKKGRPAIDGITAGISVVDTVAATLAARGHDGAVQWDAFKDDDGWVLSLTWSAGRSENRAQWLFHPGPDGGTLSARDEAAAEIVDPALRILRPLRPVRPDPVAAVLLDPVPLDPTVATDRASDRVSPAPAARTGQARSAHPAGSRLGVPTGQRPTAVADGQQTGTRFGATPRAGIRDERLVEDTVTDDRAGVNPVITRRETARTGTDSARAVQAPGVPTPAAAKATAATPTAGRPATAPAAAATPTAATPTPAKTATPAATAKSGRKGHRPAMPSWEDVLLGTRSNGH